MGRPSDLPGRGERWLPDLAEELGVMPIVVHRWRWSGRLHARQLPGENGRWVVWADRDGVSRLRRLRAYEVANRGKVVPVELTTPKDRQAERGPKGRRTRVRSDA